MDRDIANTPRHPGDMRARTATDLHDPPLQARMMVLDAANEYRESIDALAIEDIYLVSFTYILGGWKAMVSTTAPDDHYYEATHRALGESYVDVYVKVNQKVVSADDPIHNL